MQVSKLLRNTKDAVLDVIWTLLVYPLSVMVLFGVLTTLAWIAVIGILPETKRNTSLKELLTTENAVARLVRSPLTENQFSAVCCLVYNVGSGKFRSSTIRMKLNRKDYEGAANEFWKWRRAGGKILRGLVRRRKEEELLFLKC